MPDITAHRAGTTLGMENSLQALAQSIAFGTPWAEIDVQLTADGMVVVFHDADLQRLTGDPRRVRDLAFSELPSLPGGNRIPLLSEFIARARGRIGLNIELKDYGDGPALATHVAEVLQTQEFAAQALVCSFNPALTAVAKRALPGLRVGLVQETASLPHEAFDFVSVAHHAIDNALVQEAHARGMTVHAWTVNDRKCMRRLLAMDVDNVITDNPAMGMETLRAFGSLKPWHRAWLRWRA